MLTEPINNTQLIEALSVLRDNGPIDPRFGVCANVCNILGQSYSSFIYDLFGLMSKRWPLCYSKESIHDQYPIAGFEETGPKWEGVALERRNLLIEYFVEQLQNNEYNVEEMCTEYYWYTKNIDKSREWTYE